ncbi:MAG TPA: phage tail protein [Longimicrobium sp.]|nr:phage tail protein [Longimicrobium sp.]
MSGEPRDGPWPPPTLDFSADLGGGITARFRSVEVMEDGAPGAAGHVTLHAGLFSNGAPFHEWVAAIRMNTAPRRTVIITLQGERGAPRMTWTLNGARPTRITGTDLGLDGNEVAVESLEIAYETLVSAAP